MHIIFRIISVLMFIGFVAAAYLVATYFFTFHTHQSEIWPVKKYVTFTKKYQSLNFILLWLGTRFPTKIRKFLSAHHSTFVFSINRLRPYKDLCDLSSISESDRSCDSVTGEASMHVASFSQCIFRWWFIFRPHEALVPDSN